ncbi:putative clathrin assembly protein At4g40080 [Silene latifolia]|uniref:putative clathrin assembly protein At4g40080 n=1 Tax=Silene latifolia TaxID=37657 RepID=UPI003D7803F1
MAKSKRTKSLLVGILKDKISLLKATLRLTTPSLHVAVLRATSHIPDHAPTLTLSNNAHLPTLLHALLHRVNHTSDAYVALKSLLLIHHLISRNPDSLGPTSGSPPLFARLSTFRDQSDDDTWEISNWIRWYAAVLDQIISLFSRKTKSLDMLIGVVESICSSPDSLHYQKISLIYEVIKLIGEDYRLIIREIYAKVEELSTRIESFTDDSLDNFLDDLKRIENCKEKLLLMFLNKKKNDGFWELVEKVKGDVEGEKQRRESMKIVEFQGSESTRRNKNNRVERDESMALTVMPVPRVKRWLDVEWNTLVVSTNA